ncbi:MAG: DUF1320 domain-containing protein [Desulfobacteraceae bacterium]|nr:DUF1320 domain-containing protein [Desulfobacteraceae bacterium]
MAYATKQDIDDRYDDVNYPMMPDPGNQDEEIVDEGGIEKALADAAAEIDPYLAVKHSLPLADPPEILVRLSVDIALYRMVADALGNTEERRQRYEDALKTLEKISSGTMVLGIEETEASPNGGVTVSGPRRLFSRSTMAGL